MLSVFMLSGVLLSVVLLGVVLLGVGGTSFLVFKSATTFVKSYKFKVKSFQRQFQNKNFDSSFSSSLAES